MKCVTAQTLNVLTYFLCFKAAEDVTNRSAVSALSLCPDLKKNTFLDEFSVGVMKDLQRCCR